MGQAKPVIDLSHIQGLRSDQISKLKGGYSSDVGLVFCSWRMDIQTKINENNYDNKSAIRLIKEKTQEKALKEVKYQLDLNGAEMSYKDLLEHLSLMFMGGEDESTLMAVFVLVPRR